MSRIERKGMRYSQLLMPTLREEPAEAEVVSHKLMLRAGMIRKLAAGIYVFLPLGVRIMQKVERIIREEMDRSGAQEVLMKQDYRIVAQHSIPPLSELFIQTWWL